MNSKNSDRIPILLLVRELGIGGTERQLVETARFLQGERFDPHVGCFRPDGLRRKDLEQAGVPILHLPVYSFKSPAVLTAARQLLRYLRQHRIQIVHSFDAPLNVFAVPIARLAGTPAVISSQRGDRNLTTQRLKRLLRITDRLVDAVVVNCEYMRQYLIDEERVAEPKVRLCYNGIDTVQYQRRSGITPYSGRPVIGTVCALRPEKGVDTLIRAFAALRRPDAELVIVGSGPEEASLKTLCAECEVENYHFEPATNDVAEWLSRIDIFALPSRSEALSNALMEAMACGCCPVASRVGGNPELIEHGQNGLLFAADSVDELSHSLQQLLDDEPRRRKLAQAASATISSRFTFANAANTMQGIYESVLSSTGRKLRGPVASSG
jgi:glycosyltransferase involved in cell wall biosynthesis